MIKYLDQGVEGGGAQDHPRLRAVVTRYLLTVLSTTRAGMVSMRNERELRTISESLDALLAGNICRCGDLLIQRFKAIETSIADSQWGVAKHFELIPDMDTSVVSLSEREHATKLELRERKLRDHLLKKPPPFSGNRG